MDDQSRYSTMDHGDTQTLLWVQNEAVTMWKSLFGRLRRRKSDESSLHTSLCFLYILCCSNKTRDKNTTDLNGLKSLKGDFFLYMISFAYQISYLTISRGLIGKLTSFQVTTQVRFAPVGDVISSLNLMGHWSYWWQDQSSNNWASYKLASGQLVACALTWQKVVFANFWPAFIDLLTKDGCYKLCLARKPP